MYQPVKNMFQKSSLPLKQSVYTVGWLTVNNTHLNKTQNAKIKVFIAQWFWVSFERCCLEKPGTVTAITNKAVIDHRLHPRCCHLGSYFKRPKSSPVRSLACNWYYCAQLIAKPNAACALRFSWTATSSNISLWATVTSSIKPEVHNISLRRQRMILSVGRQPYPPFLGKRHCLMCISAASRPIA